DPKCRFLGIDVFCGPQGLQGEPDVLFHNNGNGAFTDVTKSAGIKDPNYYGFGVVFSDFDNDGWPDIYVANDGNSNLLFHNNRNVYPDVDAFVTGQHYAQRKDLYRNMGNGKVNEIARDAGGDLLTPKSSRGAAFGGFDNDGNVDVLVVNMNDRPSLYRNEGGTRNHWVTLRLEGRRSNRDAIGARVEIQAGGKTQVHEVRSGGSYLSHNDMRL